ncbi:transporter [Pseudomonas alcaligenes]|uniref:Transporter n=1 Tax=Aquipseudomonas alcaligenes TaxID=43263 RepID=A0ABR7S1Y8_AQUAC|nr:DUF1656 domain-containing protein [Pseudomonas alcaligenes]MBC9251601.1 transporter [Pseudomonas alcaligenes]
MALREWAWGGVLLSPLLIYALVALLLTGVLRLGLQRVGVARWIWHEALFDVALYICVLAALVALAAG